MDAVPPGSYLVILHGASDVGSDDMPEAERRYNEQASAQFNAARRSSAFDCRGFSPSLAAVAITRKPCDAIVERKPP